MLSRSEFASQVMDAYAHLYDLVYLRTHPLAAVIAPDPALSGKEKAWQVHRALLEVIRELEPGPQAPVLSRPWRRHRLMLLRYVKAMEPDVVAEQLTISRRHYYREHRIAIEALTGILWERFAVRPPAPQPAAGPAVEQETTSRMEALRLEVARMAQADRQARIGSIVQGVLPLLQEMLAARGLALRPVLPEALPPVAINDGLLRQVLLGVLGYLLERASQAAIELSARVEEGQVCLLVNIGPEAEPEPDPADDSEEELAALEQLARLSNAEIMPVHSGPALTGFEIRLPIAERTILVIDDNEDVLELFSRYLRAHHYRVATAQSARDALAEARRLQPYAITLDLMMPEQDGWDLLRTLLNHPDTQHIPIIICTVLKQKALALSLGATAFLAKPITERELLAALAALEET